MAKRYQIQQYVGKKWFPYAVLISKEEGRKASFDTEAEALAALGGTIPYKHRIKPL